MIAFGLWFGFLGCVLGRGRCCDADRLVQGLGAVVVGFMWLGVVGALDRFHSCTLRVFKVTQAIRLMQS
jgi:hypothetical protein